MQRVTKPKPKPKPEEIEDASELLVNTTMALVSHLGFRGDTRDPTGPGGTFEMGFQRRAISWESYSQNYTLVVMHETRPHDKEIKRNKLYLYQKTDGSIEYAAKKQDGKIERLPITARYLNESNYYAVKQVLQNKQQILSLKLQKDIFAVTSKKGYARHKLEPTYRKRGPFGGALHDIDPPTAVCATLLFDCAPIFPVIKEYASTQEIWINVIKIGEAFPTYQKQLENNSRLSFLLEVAMRDIPSNYVICAIKCERYWTADISIHPVSLNWDNGMHYKLVGDIIWNPKLKNVSSHPEIQNYEQAIKELIEPRIGKYIECPIQLTLSEEKKAKMTEMVKIKREIIDVLPHEISQREHDELELIRATYMGDIHTVAALLIRGVDVDHIDEKSGLTPLHIAAVDGNIELVKILLKNGASVNHGTLREDVSPLDFAVTNKKIPVVKLLLKAGANINRRDKAGYTAFHRAIVENQYDLVKLLLAAGANPFSKGPDDASVVEIADNQRMKKLLKTYISQLQGQLFSAVKHGDIELIKLLVNQGADVNCMYEHGKYNATLLFIAAESKNLNVVCTLLDCGADPEDYPGKDQIILQGIKLHTLINDFYKTNDMNDLKQLFYIVNAIEDNKILKKLSVIIPCLDFIQHNPDQFASIGKLALTMSECYLHYLQGTSAEDCYKEFLINSADMLVPLLGSCGSLKLLKHFDKHGIPMNIENSEGQTPLMYAAKQKNFDVIANLLKMGILDNDTDMQENKKLYIGKLLKFIDRETSPLMEQSIVADHAIKISIAKKLLMNCITGSSYKDIIFKPNETLFMQTAAFKNTYLDRLCNTYSEVHSKKMDELSHSEHSEIVVTMDTKKI